jgi:hypothetical protein
MLKFSKNEEKLYTLATIGGLSPEEAYFEVYKPKNRKVGMTGFRRKEKMCPIIFQNIAKYKRELLKMQQDEQRKVYIKEASERALSAIEKRERLRRIIDNEEMDIEFMVVKGEVKKIIRQPRIIDKIKALDLDCKIAGHFAEKHVKHEAGDSFIEMLRLMSEKKSQPGSSSVSTEDLKPNQ